MTAASSDRTNVRTRFVILDDRGVQHVANVYDQHGCAWAQVPCIGITVPATEALVLADEPIAGVRECRKYRCNRLFYERRKEPTDG